MKNDFKELNNVYTHIEANAIDYNFSNQIGSIFQKLRDLKLEEDIKEEAFKAQWETDFFNFGIHKGALEPLFGAADDDGNEFTYPNLENFTEEQYEYLIERLKKTKNPLIQSRYSIILWHSPKKHGQYAKITVDSLLKLAKQYEKKDKIEPHEHWGYKAFQSIENAYYIGLNAKYRINDIKLEVIRLIKGFNHKSGSSLVLRLRLIELMLEGKKNFSKNDFHGFQKVCWELSSDLISKKDFHGVIMILKLGEKVDNKTENKTYIWRKRIAEAYESLMEDASQKENLASIDFCLSAINNYQKINGKEKIKELKEKYENLNQNIELGKFSVPLKNYNKHLNEMEEFADDLTDKDSEVLIEFLMLGYKFLLPKFEEMENMANNINKNTPLLAMCSKVVLDPRGHPSKHYTSEEDKKYHQIIQNYKLFIEVSKPFLYSFFTNAIYKKKLSPQIILEYLRAKTWLGTVYENKVYNETVQHDWIALLAPSIFEYFRQIEIFFLNPVNNISNFTLCTDSLVLKLEGIIRDFCALNSIKTFEVISRKEKTTVQEKSLNKLLNEKKLEEILGKNDLLFLKILLVEQSGYNLRNEVAHSLLSSNNYDFGKIHLLLLALFRLAKYVINDKSP